MLLQVIDQLWRQHIAALDALRQGIYLRGYAQKQPKQEYKREAFTMFEQLLDSIRETTTTVLMRVEIKQPEEAQAAAEDNLARGEARADASHLADADASQGLNAGQFSGSAERGRERSLAGGFPSLRPQRSVPLRFREEVQGLPRPFALIAF